MTERDKILISSYLESSETNLEQSISSILSSERELLVNASKEELDKKNLNQYLLYCRRQLKTQICGDSQVRSIIESNKSNIEIIIVLVDFLAPFVGSPPAAMVATLLLKKGISNLCDED